MSKLAKDLLLGLLIVYALIITAIIASVSSGQRKAFVNDLAEKTASHFKPRVVMIGDSLTANGMPWGWKLFRLPLSVVSKARGGYTVRQIANITDPDSWGYTTDAAVISAGMNDAFDPYSTPERFENDYRELLRVTKKCHCRILITLITPTKYPKHNILIQQYNGIIRRIAKQEKVDVIDLWPELIEAGKIRQKDTVDGVHFTRSAYDIWVKHLKSRLAR
ncbi:SGNH/GDSL hydrolase family protein [Sphingomonas sp. R86520]|uniref:SGNH/GDSL hydrolase family protein n=1 Tax=Sphingomonas sp. R86520 TaxID=3093859 RepID=UPI0036D432ED